MRMLKKHGHWLFFGLMALITVYMDSFIAQHVLDGDASDYMNRGWIMAQQRNPFTRDLYLTTEVRLLDFPVVFAAFFLLTDNWTLVRILGTITVQAYYVLSFWYLCKQADVDRKIAVIGAGMLLMPFSTPYARLVLYHLYYILYMANAFWIMGFTLRVLYTPREQKRRALLPAALLAGMWVYVGLNGIRHMMIIGIPMLAVAIVQCLCTLREYQWQDGRLCGPEPFWRTQPVRLLEILLASCLCFAAGYVINARVLLPYYGVQDMSSAFFLPGLKTDHYSQIFNGWLLSTGIRYTKQKLVGPRGLALIASLFSFGYLLAVSLAGCFEKGSAKRSLMKSVLGASFVTTTLIFLFETAARTYQIYYAPVVALAALPLTQELTLLKKRGVSACRKALILLTCGCFLYQGIYSLYFIRVDKTAMDRWDGMEYYAMDTVDQVRDCAAFMQENGYTHGFINYWYASPMIELSNGALNVAGIQNAESSERIELCRWGSSKSAFEPENMPEKVMVFIEREQAPAFESLFPALPLVHEGWIFNGYEADSSLIQ